MRRWAPILAAIVILLLVVGLYKAKTDAGETRDNIAALTREVKQEQQKVRTLRAEVAHLENPERIEDLAEQNLELEKGAEGRRLPESAMSEDLPAPRGERTK